jgi:predicted phosphodiesterase
MRVAIIADIHGNLLALEAVFADMRHRDIDQTINLGDCVSGPLWPRDVCELLMATPMLTIRGNHDRWVSGPDPRRMGASDCYAHGKLRNDQLHWLGALPGSADAGDGIFACHGTPTDDNLYLVEQIDGGRLVRAEPTAIQHRLGDTRARVVLCGHSHQPHLIQLPHGPLVLNPGSVGCPAYDDPGDDPHVSESGSPHARYAVLSIGQRHVAAELLAVSYDWNAASQRAESIERPDWAYALRTGFMPRSER